jgi:hypothetical protein
MRAVVGALGNVHDMIREMVQSVLKGVGGGE